MKTSLTAILLFVVAALFGAVGQYLYKTVLTGPVARSPAIS